MSMKIKVPLLISVIALFFMSSIVTAGDKITVCGTGDSQELLRVLARVFEASHSGTTIEVPDSIGSSGGIRATADGKCDLGRVARPLKEKERKYNLHYRLFAVSPVVIVASAGIDGVSNLSSVQVVKIFSGKITSWSTLGGPNTKIYVANREAGDSSRSVLEKNMPGFKKIVNFTGKTIYSTPETVEILSKYNNTIGYSSLAAIKGTTLRIMKIDGIYPSVHAVRSGRYKLATPLGLVWREGLKGLAKDFVEYLDSVEAKKIMLERGAVPRS